MFLFGIDSFYYFLFTVAFTFAYFIKNQRRAYQIKFKSNLCCFVYLLEVFLNFKKMLQIMYLSIIDILKTYSQIILWLRVVNKAIDNLKISRGFQEILKNRSNIGSQEG